MSLTPQWLYLKDPVPQVVADRAAALLKAFYPHVGAFSVETCAVDCHVQGTASPLSTTRVLRYTCENHAGGKIGVSVYGLV